VVNLKKQSVDEEVNVEERNEPKRTNSLAKNDSILNITQLSFYDRSARLKEIDKSVLEVLYDIDLSKFEAVYNDPYLKEVRKYSESHEVYYYSISEVNDYQRILYYLKGDYGHSLVIVHYSKEFDIIDEESLVESYGDAGFYTYSEINYQNDSILLKQIIEDKLLVEDKINGGYRHAVSDTSFFKLRLFQSGQIKLDTIRR